jgi:GH15 family glucan-1,4-alpha-glucosidase
VAALIEDYALLSDCRTGAMVSRAGSIDWLCLPRFDSPSVFAALLGRDQHGCWALRPVDPEARASRHYDGDSFVLVTRWETATGVAEVRDFMPMERRRLDSPRRSDVLRRITGVAGRVEFEQQVVMRFDYARAIPWMRQVGTADAPAVLGTAGPDAVIVRGAPLSPVDYRHVGTVEVGRGQHIDLSLTWFPSHYRPPVALDVTAALERTRSWWHRWAQRIAAGGRHRDAVRRSLLVLRALSHYDTGGIIAAPTTSLPEKLGGSRNWDYRYVWLRDAALTLQVLVGHGFLEVAHNWRGWLLRAIAGEPSQLQIMYGIGGERDLFERELPGLPGYDDASPVRIGNGAGDQYQADVIGEVLWALGAARRAGIGESSFSWNLQCALVNRLIDQRGRPDNGMWEIRNKPRMFTHSRVMMWAGLDSAIQAVQYEGLEGPVEAWIKARDRLADEIARHGVSRDGYFTQYYGSREVDASLLLLPQVGFCRPDDPRMLATVARIEETLMSDGLLHRYRTSTGTDGLDGEENPFVACSFWLVEQYAATGRLLEAEALMDRLCGLANDVGLLSEEYDVHTKRHTGNTPQAFSHLTLIRAADALARAAGTRAVDEGDHLLVAADGV